MKFLIVHPSNGAKNVLLNLDAICSIQEVNDGRTTRIALGRGDDLFVSETYDSIMSTLIDMDSVRVCSISSQTNTNN